MKKEWKVIHTNTLFLTFCSAEFPKEIIITVRYLKVKVALFVRNPMRCFNCDMFGHTSQGCKISTECHLCRKEKYERLCEGPKLCSNCNAGLEGGEGNSALPHSKTHLLSRSQTVGRSKDAICDLR